MEDAVEVLEAAAPFMEGEAIRQRDEAYAHDEQATEMANGVNRIAVEKVAAAEAKAATLAAQIEAVREAAADMPTCEHTPLNSARRYWCSTFNSYAPCFGEDMAAVLRLDAATSLREGAPE
jgi:hypothetical protein